MTYGRLDPLLATATQADLTRDAPAYPTPQMIADRWRNDTDNNVRYFSNNVRDGIRTFEDGAIRAVLDAPREGSSPPGRDAGKQQHDAL